MRTAKELCDEWAGRVIPKDAAEYQRRDMEMAFHAGALALLGAVIEDLAELPEPEGQAELKKIYNELVNFFKLRLAEELIGQQFRDAMKAAALKKPSPPAPPSAASPPTSEGSSPS